MDVVGRVHTDDGRTVSLEKQMSVNDSFHVRMSIR